MAEATTVVIDASFAGAWFIDDEWSDKADSVLARIEAREVELVVPALWSYEVGNLLVMAVRRRRLAPGALPEASVLLERLARSEEPPPTVSQQRTLELALAHQLTFYDAAYLEIAMRLSACLLTTDRALRTAATRAGVAVRLSAGKRGP